MTKRVRQFAIAAVVAAASFAPTASAQRALPTEEDVRIAILAMRAIKQRLEGTPAVMVVHTSDGMGARVARALGVTPERPEQLALCNGYNKRCPTRPGVKVIELIPQVVKKGGWRT